MFYSKRGVMLRKWHGRLEAFLGSGNTLSLVGSAPPVGSAVSIMIRTIVPLLMILALITCMVYATLHPAHLSPLAGLALGGLTAPKSGNEQKKPAKIREMENNLKAIASELEAGQIEMAAGPISQERGEELEAKAKEMEDIQEHIDRYNRIAGITEKSRQVSRVTLPGEGESGRKTVRTTPGHLFVMSDAYKNYQLNGKNGWSANVDLKGFRLGSKQHIKLHGEEAVNFERKAFDPATLPTLGTDAIIPIDRDPEIVRFAEPEILTIRDVLNEVPTSSDAIKYVRHTATVRAAATQATRGAAKNYLTITFDTQTTNVETIAVLSKVTEQDIDDAPRLVGYINNEMDLDIKVQEEEQLVWSDGTGGKLTGLFAPTSGIQEFDRAGGSDTLVDLIRRMRTDLRKNRVVPSFVAIDPIDWEEIELTKGTTEQYVWGLITDLRGPRIWSLTVVESDAMTNNDTGERRILMGDGKRGATIYNRQDTRLAIGFVDDDFARNLRTLRAEERLALAIKRPFAFEYSITNAGA
jgi:HK97 family phage major capsid protein